MDAGWGMLGMGGLSFLGGLLQGDMGQTALNEAQTANLLQQNRLTNAQWYDLSRMAAAQRGSLLANTGLTNAQTGYTGAQTDALQQRTGQRATMFNNAQNMLGQEIFNPMANMNLLATAMQPQQNKLLSSLGSRGISGGGALAGALSNLQTNQMAMPLFNAMQQNAYATSNRDMNLLSMFT